MTCFPLTGDGAAVPETLYTLNTSTAAATFVKTLGTGADGEIIARGPLANVLYHSSGNTVSYFETINLSTLTTTIVGPTSNTETFSMG